MDRNPARARMRRILRALRRDYAPGGRIRTQLRARGPYRILVAVLLSAQCTDKAVNGVLPRLFQTYPSPARLARAAPAAVGRIIRRLGLWRSKSRHLAGLGRLLMTRHAGRVPPDLAALEALPGVGRKTALVVLHHAFGLRPGIAVDTHAGRIARRLGFSRAASPEGVERDLLPIVPPAARGELTNLLIAHGRAVCRAVRPSCGRCRIRTECPYESLPSGRGMNR